MHKKLTLIFSLPVYYKFLAMCLLSGAGLLLWGGHHQAAITTPQEDTPTLTRSRNQGEAAGQATNELNQFSRHVVQNEGGVPTKAQIALPSWRMGVTAEDFAVSRRLARLDETEQTPRDRSTIGVARPVKLTVSDMQQGKLARTLKNAEGNQVRVLTIQSPDAVEMFAHLTEFDLPEGEEVYVYGNALNSPVGGPYRRRGPANGLRDLTGKGGDFWTETAQGDTLIIEHYSAQGVPRGKFAVPEVTHNFTPFLASAPEQTQPLDCHNDANCRAINLNDAVGRVSYMRDGKNRNCSGTMLATRNDSEFGEPPYFLTANHCIANYDHAASAQITWRARTTGCNTHTINSDTFFTSERGTGLLKTRRPQDQTLLRVYGKVPATQVYAGWDPRRLGITDAPSVFGLHHPRGSYLRRSDGTLAFDSFGCDATGLEEGYDIIWGSGITEPGSSGSGLYFSSSQLLFGVLSCGIDVENCTLKKNSRYGRFREFYGEVTSWIESGDRGPSPTPQLNSPTAATPTIVNDTLTSALPSRVLGAQNGISTYYGKLYRIGGLAGQKYRITATAPNFNPYLFLLNGLTRELIVDDNDDLIPGTITITLPETSPYYLEISSFNTEETGAYTLKIELICDLSLNRTDVFLPAKAGIASAVLSNPNFCNWTATSNAAWLRLQKTSGGDRAAEPIVADLDAFTSTFGSRTGIIQVSGQQFQVHQAHQCVATAITAGQLINGSLGITDCRAPENNDTIGVFPYADLYSFNGTAGQRIAIEMDATEFTPRLLLRNPAGTQVASDAHDSRARIPYPKGFFTLPTTGLYTIEAAHNENTPSAMGAYKIRVLSDCNTLVTPTPDAILAAGTTINFTVTANTTCPWNAFSYASWVKINSGETGAGNGTVNVTIAANNGPARETQLLIAGQSFTIQQRSGCRFTVDPASRNFTSGGGAGSFNVMASNSECPWGITPNGPSGMFTYGQVLGQKGNGTVGYVVKANTGAARVGQLLIGDSFTGSVHTMNQAAVANNPAPTLSNFSPAFVVAGEATFTLTLTGTNFLPGSVVRLNGTTVDPRFYSDTKLEIEINAALVKNPAELSVVVSNPTPGGGVTPERKFPIYGPLANLSAASYVMAVSPDSIVAVFGNKLARATETARTIPLPTNLQGTTVKLRDRAGKDMLAPLFFVSATQINYLFPAGLATGPIQVTITNSNGEISFGEITLTALAPALFTANASGKDAPAALVLRVLTDGRQVYENVATFDRTLNRWVPLPINLDNGREQVFLILYGSGLRGNTSLRNVTAAIGRARYAVAYAGAQGGLVGLDQVNLLLPNTFTGSGEIPLSLIVEGKATNEVTIAVK